MILFFSAQISRTPPEEKNRRAREAAESAMNELAFLVLTPFCQIPRVEFDGVRLGKTAVRKCVVQNPGKKPIKVWTRLCLEIDNYVLVLTLDDIERSFMNAP